MPWTVAHMIFRGSGIVPMLTPMPLSDHAQAYQLAQAHTCAIGHLETTRAAD